MAYTKQTWTDDVSAVTGARMTHIEDGIYDNSTDVTAVKSALDLSANATKSNTDLTAGQVTDVIGIKDIKYKGQTSQDTYQGYNLCDSDTELRQGGTVSASDTTRNSISMKYQLKANTKYTFVTNINLSNFAYAICTGIVVSPWAVANQLSDTGWIQNVNHTTITTTEVCYMNIVLRKSDNTALTPSTVQGYQYMVYEGEYNSSKQYEPYVGAIASPNPDYPQDVQVVRGSNKVKICGKNLFDKSNNSLILNGFLNGATNKYQANANARTVCLPCKPNTTYTVSKTSSQRFITGQTTSSTIENGIAVTLSASTASMASQSVTTSANAKYILVFYYLSTEDTLSEETIRNSIQIEVGSIATSFEAFKGGEYDLDLGNINSYANIDSQTLNGMTITRTNNGYILKGTTTANTTFRGTIANPKNTNKTLVVKCDTAVTNVNIQIKTRDSGGAQLRSISLSTANVWETSSGTYTDVMCDIYIKSGVTLTNVLVQPMLLDGTVTNVLHYVENTDIDYTIELCKIGNYQDYIYKNNGKWFVHKETNMKKVIGNDISSLNSSDATKGVYQYGTPNGYLPDVITSTNPWNADVGLCNYFKKDGNVNNLNSYCFTISQYGPLAINSPETTLANFKAWVDSVDLLVYYVKQTPIEEEITYEPLIRQLETIYNAGMYDITNISQENADKEFLLDIVSCCENYNGIIEYIRR